MPTHASPKLHVNRLHNNKPKEWKHKQKQSSRALFFVISAFAPLALRPPTQFHSSTRQIVTSKHSTASIRSMRSKKSSSWPEIGAGSHVHTRQPWITRQSTPQQQINGMKKPTGATNKSNRQEHYFLYHRHSLRSAARAPLALELAL